MMHLRGKHLENEQKRVIQNQGVIMGVIMVHLRGKRLENEQKRDIQNQRGHYGDHHGQTWCLQGRTLRKCTETTRVATRPKRIRGARPKGPRRDASKKGPRRAAAVFLMSSQI